MLKRSNVFSSKKTAVSEEEGTAYGPDTRGKPDDCRRADLVIKEVKKSIHYDISICCLSGSSRRVKCMQVLKGYEKKVNKYDGSKGTKKDDAREDKVKSFPIIISPIGLICSTVSCKRRRETLEPYIYEGIQN